MITSSTASIAELKAAIKRQYHDRLDRHYARLEKDLYKLHALLASLRRGGAGRARESARTGRELKAKIA
jgi:hypothetical protein